MSETGLVLVDPYNDFLADDGRLWPRIRDVAEAVGLREHLRALLEGVRAAGIAVFVAPHRRWRPGDVDGWTRARRPHTALRDARLYALGTPGGEWHPEFGPRPGDVVATEHWAMSGFAHTDLDQQLRQHGIGHIILAGLTAPGCVEGTGRFAMELGYGVTLVKDATAAFTMELQRAATEQTGPLYADAVLTTAEVLRGL
ncbi:cysteine hydrolase [Dactylosporangium vinaceum]|uniref:Cysteine hydrolase family protein n=1 Tax=Dactylosporangium vinaceum TaxID=53362 RepID=A0ABV5ME22_9ACTN|nr:cysteine hydrolase [Dactylosporangium vinaceum]UAB92527.1 cysteine hydrolase [Dactylosporangium vinaceum]